MKRLTTKRICLLSLLLGIMIIAKYIFGFIPGVEIITFLFIVFGIVLPILDLSLLIISFNIIVVIMYGFGPWWLVYWIIWPIDAFVGKLIFKFTKKIYFLSLWGFFAGFLVFFWYFLSDMLIFGFNFALLNVITAIPINLIEGFTTMICILLFSRRIFDVFDMYKLRFWPKSQRINIQPVRVKWRISSLMVVSSASSIFILFGLNNVFTTLKNNILNTQNRPGVVLDSNGDKILNKYISIDKTNSLHYLNSKYYNEIYSKMNNNQVSIAVIANNKVIYDQISIRNKSENLYSIMNTSKKLEFQYVKFSLLGYAVGEYRTKGTLKWMHGTSNIKMNNNYVPYIYQNHKFASLGASSLTVVPKSIYEFTYDS